MAQSLSIKCYQKYKRFQKLLPVDPSQGVFLTCPDRLFEDIGYSKIVFKSILLLSCQFSCTMLDDAMNCFPGVGSTAIHVRSAVIAI